MILGTGKTSLTLRLCRLWSLPVYVVDGDPTPYRTLGLEAARISWDDVLHWEERGGASRATIVADDVTKLKDVELGAAKHLTNYLRRGFDFSSRSLIFDLLPLSFAAGTSR